MSLSPPTIANALPWLHYLEQCDSTNTWALAQRSSGVESSGVELQHGDVVFTRRQLAGRGQHDRAWFSPAGVLTVSFVCDRVPAAQLPALSLATGVAIVRTIAPLLPDPKSLRLKWPNDVMLKGRKLAGVLCEARSGRESGQSRVIVGIGLNRCVEFGQKAEDWMSQAISLHQVCDRVPDDLLLLSQLRHSLLQLCDQLTAASGLTNLLPELRQRDLLLNRAIVVEAAGDRIAGQGAGLDAWGRLQVRLPSGEVRAIASGRVIEY